jgi:DNA primase
MNTIDEIKQKLDIVEVVSGYVPDLKKSGRNFAARCPFHVEKTPSFFVFPDRQSWHCFGACATGGDVFSFVMKKEGVEFKESLRILADRAGVIMEPRYSAESETEADRLKKINEAAADYYHRQLLQSAAGKGTLGYLLNRGVSDASIRAFQLGYSPDTWDSLRQELGRAGFQEEEMAAAGLLVLKERERGYDRFRNRLMFPIRDISGRVLGFGARVLDDSLPKYLNSPQSPIFDKSNSLYGIDLAKSAIRKQDSAVVVEGYMDVIIAHQYGFTNVVASLGTALTEKQVGMIKKMTKNLTLALDADAAGAMATLRGIEVASQTFDRKVVPLPTSAGLVKYEDLLDAEIRVMVLPAGKDPDDMIKSNPESWKEALEKAAPVIDYTFNVVINSMDPGRVKDKAEATDRLLPLIAEIKHPVRQAHYLQKLARAVGVDEQVLVSALTSMRRHSRSVRSEMGAAQPSKLVTPLSTRDTLAEYCLYLLIKYPELRSQASGLSADFFPHTENREIFLAWQGDSRCEGLDATLEDHLDEVLKRPYPPLDQEEEERALSECIYRLRERWLREMKTKEKMLLSAAEVEGSPLDLQELERLALKFNAELGEVFLHGRERKVKKAD